LTEIRIRYQSIRELRVDLNEDDFGWAPQRYQAMKCPASAPVAYPGARSKITRSTGAVVTGRGAQTKEF